MNFIETIYFQNDVILEHFIEISFSCILSEMHKDAFLILLKENGKRYMTRVDYHSAFIRRE